jgi:hypothetical protein
MAVRSEQARAYEVKTRGRRRFELHRTGEFSGNGFEAYGCAIRDN